MTEAEQVRRAHAGDSQAFELLCERCAPQLRMIVRKLIPARLHRAVSVSDLLQDAYLTAYRRLGDYEHRGEGAFGAWLAQIVRNKVRDVARRYMGTAKRGAATEVSRNARQETAAFAGRGPSPSQHAIAAELQERVRAAMAGLPADYREVLELRQQEYLTLDETARRMGRTKDSVKKLCARALERLAQVVKVSQWRQRHE